VLAGYMTQDCTEKKMSKTKAMLILSKCNYRKINAYPFKIFGAGTIQTHKRQ